MDFEGCFRIEGDGDFLGIGASIVGFDGAVLLFAGFGMLGFLTGCDLLGEADLCRCDLLGETDLCLARAVFPLLDLSLGAELTEDALARCPEVIIASRCLALLAKVLPNSPGDGDRLRRLRFSDLLLILLFLCVRKLPPSA